MTQGSGTWRRDAGTGGEFEAPDGTSTTAPLLAPEESAFARPRTASAFPTIPNRTPRSPDDGGGRRGGGPLALTAFIAALVGGLLASAATVVTLDRRPDQLVEAPQAQPVQAPPVAVVEGRTQVEVVAEAVLPTVVQIDIDGGGPEGSSSGNGSGVIYRSDGHIITNNHVVAGAQEMQIVFADGSRAEAELVGRDVLSDIAVVKVEKEGLTAIRIGDSANLRVGQLAVAIGSPFGLEGSVTAGVISALNRPIQVGQGIRLPNVIQTDAPINPGNSGGALVGADGALIGINSAILTAGSPANAGVGFAVPVSTAVDIADELITSGSVTYPYLGVQGTNVPLAAVDRLGVDKGALIERVEPDTPAAAAGLQPDDVVVSIGGNEIATMDELIVAVRQADVGDTLEVVYIRDRRERRVDVTLVERPDL